MLSVCRRRDWALNEYPGATFHKDQNILEVKGVAIFLWILFTFKLSRFISCMSYKPRLPSPLADPRQGSLVRKGEEMNADQNRPMQGPCQNRAHQMEKQLSSCPCHLPLLLGVA